MAIMHNGFCEQCGTPLEVGSKFCELCGTPVAPEVEPASPPPRPVMPAPPPLPQRPVMPLPLSLPINRPPDERAQATGTDTRSGLRRIPGWAWGLAGVVGLGVIGVAAAAVLLMTGMLNPGMLIPALSKTPQESETPSQNTPLPTTIAGQTSLAFEAIKQNGEMVVGTSADFPPFEYVDSAGNIIGFDVELLNEVAKGMGIKVKWVDMPFDNLVAAVQEGKIDLSISAFNYTEERDKNVDFTEAYYSAKDQFMVSETFAETIAAPEDFAKYKIGVGNGTIQEGWVTENLVDKGLMPGENLFHYDRADQAALDVLAGQIDTYIGDNAVIDALIKQLAGLKVAFEAELSSGPIMMIVPEGAKELKAALDEQIKKLNESGFTTELAVKYMGGGQYTGGLPQQPDGQPTNIPVMPSALPSANSSEEEFFAFKSDVRADNGVTEPTEFTIHQAWLVTAITTYHWNNAKGTPSPGMIGLLKDGEMYGPWEASGTPGQGGVPNAYWTVNPGIDIPAGSYTVIDSDPLTWAQNDETGGAGMSWGIGFRLNNP